MSPRFATNGDWHSGQNDSSPIHFHTGILLWLYIMAYKESDPGDANAAQGEACSANRNVGCGLGRQSFMVSLRYAAIPITACIGLLYASFPFLSTTIFKIFLFIILLTFLAWWGISGGMKKKKGKQPPIIYLGVVYVLVDQGVYVGRLTNRKCKKQ